MNDRFELKLMYVVKLIRHVVNSAMRTHYFDSENRNCVKRMHWMTQFHFLFCPYVKFVQTIILLMSYQLKIPQFEMG